MSKIINDIENNIYSVMAYFGIEDYSNEKINDLIKQTKMKNEDLAYELCKSPESIKDYKSGRIGRKTRVYVGRELRKLIK